MLLFHLHDQCLAGVVRLIPHPRARLFFLKLAMELYAENAPSRLQLLGLDYRPVLPRHLEGIDLTNSPLDIRLVMYSVLVDCKILISIFLLLTSLVIVWVSFYCLKYVIFRSVNLEILALAVHDQIHAMRVQLSVLFPGEA